MSIEVRYECPEPWTHAVAGAQVAKLAELLKAAIDLLDDRSDEAWARLAKAVDEVQG